MTFAIHLYYRKTRFKGSTLLIRDQGSLRKIGRVVIFLCKETLVPKKHPHLYSFPPFFVNLIIEFTGTYKLFIINSFPGFENIKFTFYFISFINCIVWSYLPICPFFIDSPTTIICNLCIFI
ncbi:hypothetical protein ES705_46478 [subsurface metagenome]